MSPWSQHFCTLFDSGYLTRGLAMLESLHRAEPEARIAVFCFDERAHSILRELNWPFVIPISLQELETDPLLSSVKASRTSKEYCWTSTPFTVWYCLEKLKFPSCTYLDADLFFFGSPKSIFEEAPEKSVLITEHRYTPRFDQSVTSGIYCVQFVGFVNNEEGRVALGWWRNACAEWCFDRVEEGKFGDQKYLDDWTTRFRGVHVVKHLGAGVAPWNIQQYEISQSGENTPSVRQGGATWPVVFYHFHALKMLKDGSVDLCPYPLSQMARENLYLPYLKSLSKWEESIRARFSFQAVRAALPSLLKRLKRIYRGTSNFWPLERN